MDDIEDGMNYCNLKLSHIVEDIETIDNSLSIYASRGEVLRSDSVMYLSDAFPNIPNISESLFHFITIAMAKQIIENLKGIDLCRTQSISQKCEALIEYVSRSRDSR